MKNAQQLNTTVSDAQFKAIGDMIYRHCGIHLHEGKRELVSARIAKEMRRGNFDSVDAYLRSVTSSSNGEFDALVDAISTNLTSFFRESSHFDYLATRHLPALCERKLRMGRKRLRCWSAGCSTGEEPYTIGMTLLDSVPDSGKWDIKVLATDICRTVLNTAQRGLYNEDRLKTVAPGIRHRFFNARSVDGTTLYEVSPMVRQLVRFNYLNLMQQWPFDGKFDFIFCRNVMIYFDQPTQERLVQRFWDALEPGGTLFTGHSESLTGIAHRFQFVQPTIYLKNSGS